ncbi:adenylate/guanylate cyclase domain-containing protein [Mesorhizobium sp. M1E.F.Ca.ET.063.01.1.1]|uniref:adenylate/guanylate cyclase domain-containing protein n=2 Tax=unclassified Mesorhizobium TaxID=325217 RepID=UPI000FCB9BD6|nr:adenylate/guanylate cyclase domain-containing protein [Mesorhizobium sp. M1E.F.Ca.ET.063.01.1.1]RUW86307.1 adenylate/guanylate cyclase domain-containing protein [Mesorhizobium sp. M1E.F.Ca.ET.063.01.1.1]
MLRRLSIRSKLLAILLLGGIACTAATGLVADRSGSQSLGASIFGQLTTLRESKKSEVERYFAELERQFVVLSRAPATIDAMVAFTSGYKTLQGEHEPPPELLSFYEKDYLPKIESLVEGELSAASYMPTDPLALRLQTDYIARNSFPVDEKQKLLSAGTGTSYDIAHERYHPFLTRAAEASNLSDIMLVDAQTGTVVYTIYKGIDFGSNVVDGPLAQSGIGRAFASALRDGTSDGSVVLEDFRAYPPSLLAPAAFIAVPIIRDGQTLGILIAEVSKDDLDAVMTSNGRWADVGLGKTGEAFLVGPDHRMRSGSRFQRETPDSYFAALSRVGISDADIERIRRFNSAVLNQPDNSRAAEEALRGQSGTDILQDYRGVDVLASWAPIDVLGTRWAILAKMDVAEALAPVSEFRRRVVQVAAAAAAVLTLVSLFAAGAFTRPIREVLAGVNRLAAGDEKTRIPVNGSDEFSELSRAFNTMADEIATRSDKIAQKTGEYEALLRNVFPEIVAERIKMGEESVAEVVKNVAVTVIDIDGINVLVTDATQDTLKAVNELISDIDEAALDAGVEKTHSFGETYIAACGLSTPRLDGARRILSFIAAVAEIAERHSRNWSIPLTVKAAVALGDVEVGLVGQQRTVYSMWGLTVLTARRIVFDADANSVRITKPVLEQLPDADGFVKKPSIPINQAEAVDTWQGPIAAASSVTAAA